MKEKQPLVTVYIPTHNRAHLVERAVLSVINQTYGNIEIIIVDDGSTDETPKVLGLLCNKYPCIKTLRHDKAKGACAARNLAIENANGEFVTGLDDDDEFLPHRVGDFVNNYSSNYSFLCTSYEQKNDLGLIKSICKKKVISFDDMKNRNHVVGHVFIKKSQLTNDLRFFEDMPAWQDYDLYFRLIKIYGPAFIINNHSYRAYADGIGDRITDSSNAYSGFRMFIERHENDLTVAQVNNQAVNDLYNRKVRLSTIETIRTISSVYTGKRLLLLWMLLNWPKLYKTLIIASGRLSQLWPRK